MNLKKGGVFAIVSTISVCAGIFLHDYVFSWYKLDKTKEILLDSNKRCNIYSAYDSITNREIIFIDDGKDSTLDKVKYLDNDYTQRTLTKESISHADKRNFSELEKMFHSVLKESKNKKQKL